MNASRSGSKSPTLIFACSGAADVGAIADQAARRLTQKGHGSMFCLAGIGGRVSGIMEKTEAATGILAIDGCPLVCAKNSLDQAGFSEFVHLELSSMGMPKGESPPDDDRIDRVVDRARQAIGR